MAKTDEKQMRLDYEKVQKTNKELEKENKQLRGTSEDLVKARGSIKAEQQKTSNIQGQYNELLKKSQGLEKTVENYSDPKELKDSLKASNQLVSEKESKVQELQRSVTILQKEKQDLLSKDDRSAVAMQQVHDKEKEIKHLENELGTAKKKLAKHEGDFRFPPGGTILLSVPMGDGKVAEAAFYPLKHPGAPAVIIQAVTLDGKAVSVDFKKA